MKRPTDLLIRLLLLIALAMASLPSGATETVCVLGSGKRVVEVAKCGMPCCAGQPAKAIAASRRSCCVPKAAKPIAKRERCGISKACRCETRLVAGREPGPPTATAPVSLEFAAFLPTARWEAPPASLALAEAGMAGRDAGPPRKRPRTSRRSRAPPVASF